ncbi:hypothetical protein BGZ60DRAFT_16617 [Tricladium varicosporioides]|nr:hypothetical protein BGZ60DRAFT_16617 [Hymenoscyphus varicosporioides]
MESVKVRGEELGLAMNLDSKITTSTPKRRYSLGEHMAHPVKRNTSAQREGIQPISTLSQRMRTTKANGTCRKTTTVTRAFRGDNFAHAQHKFEPSGYSNCAAVSTLGVKCPSDQLLSPFHQFASNDILSIRKTGNYRSASAPPSVRTSTTISRESNQTRINTNSLQSTLLGEIKKRKDELHVKREELQATINLYEDVKRNSVVDDSLSDVDGIEVASDVEKTTNYNQCESILGGDKHTRTLVPGTCLSSLRSKSSQDVIKNPTSAIFTTSFTPVNPTCAFVISNTAWNPSTTAPSRVSASIDKGESHPWSSATVTTTQVTRVVNDEDDMPVLLRTPNSDIISVLPQYPIISVGTRSILADDPWYFGEINPEKRKKLRSHWRKIHNQLDVEDEETEGIAYCSAQSQPLCSVLGAEMNNTLQQLLQPSSSQKLTPSQQLISELNNAPLPSQVQTQSRSSSPIGVANSRRLRTNSNRWWDLLVGASTWTRK